MLHKGILKDWDPVKNTGFIQRANAGPDVRISSTDFIQKPEQLQNGDRIFFQIEVDQQDKPKAVKVYKAGQRFGPPAHISKPELPSLRIQHLLSAALGLSLLTWLVYQSAYLFTAEAAQPIQTIAQTEVVTLHPPLTAPTQAQQPVFHCEGKQHCSEVSSCDEAKFYLNHCPNTLMDGDQDGIPCEQHYCGHSRF